MQHPLKQNIEGDQEMNMNIIGDIVKHKTRGIGTVTKFEEIDINKYIWVKFEDGKLPTEMKMQFPGAFVDWLVHMDPEKNDAIQKELEQNNTASSKPSKESEPPLTFEGILERRGIEEFVHFTSVKNLKSILKYGLLSVAEQRKYHISAEINDKQRLDNNLNGISLSVSFPNYKMFYKLNQGNYNGWVILSLDPNEIIKKECFFLPKNAACRGIDISTSRAQKDYMSPESFENMFKNRGEHKRGEMGLPDNYTTDPQAEIMVKSYIPVNCIKKIYFPNNSIDTEIATLLKNRNIISEVDNKLYNCRQDYAFWPSDQFI